jgi:hypothetical protein
MGGQVAATEGYRALKDKFNKEAVSPRMLSRGGKALWSYLRDPGGRKLSQQAAQTSAELAKRQKSTRSLAEHARWDAQDMEATRKAADLTAKPTFSGTQAGQTRRMMNSPHYDPGGRDWGKPHYPTEPAAADLREMILSQRQMLSAAHERLINTMLAEGRVPPGAAKALPSWIGRVTGPDVQTVRRSVKLESDRLGRLQGRLRQLGDEAHSAAGQSQRSNVAAQAAKKAEHAAAGRAQDASDAVSKRQKLNTALKATSAGAGVGAAAGAANSSAGREAAATAKEVIKCLGSKATAAAAGAGKGVADVAGKGLGKVRERLDEQMGIKK